MLWPVALISRRTTAEPMKPQPPVSNIRIDTLIALLQAR
jgi:hypothetical protein